VDFPRFVRRLHCYYGGSIRDNDVDLKADELGRDLGDALGSSLHPASSCGQQARKMSSFALRAPYELIKTAGRSYFE
jgi:hypothetical protein